ncbi:alpha-L-rhamnosidase C-terminal domain-containing protein [Proteiniphilum sp. UBA5384]|uniref:alpha-L-rhamnosidase-related protein n=1 Tax=Proteiniphilum sp. UBA5384 TaxID=1947279 RepID=UPI0025CF4330|nr:alpha-L-rhamnosidase C-terminal domain-containing protein [Proteiniphilum sp. UBA5384]
MSLHFFLLTVVHAQKQSVPHGLTVNLLSRTGKVYLNGYPSTTPIEKAVSQRENFQFTEISARVPFFGWIVPAQKENTRQTAYRLLVASRKDFLLKDSADLWDSGKVDKNSSANVLYSGKQLAPGKVYFWKVKTWNQQGEESGFSEISAFKTAEELTDYATDRYPIQKQDEYPVKINRIGEIRHFADFGKAAFGRIRVNLYSDTGTDSVIIHLGETEKNGAVNRSPGASIRYSQYKIGLNKGWKTYLVTIRPDKRNTGAQAVLMPEYIGEVTPFRYCEIENYNHPLQEKDLVRETVFYPFNDFDSHFHSSDTILNQVWDISKYSIKATSFLGIYVDGDRERIPYEADALINQLSHYAVARDYSMARYTHEYLIRKPTWPTEWHLQSVLIAWEDYMYTGNTLSLAHFYEDLQAKTLMALSDENGFISTRTGKVTPEVLQSVHFNGEIRDIIDWPHTGILGLEKEEGGETDGFVFTDINTVVNAFHYRTLVLMAQIAETLGKTDDRKFYDKRAAKLKQSFNTYLFDHKRGVYMDGIGTNHASLHANMFPLAFGLVPEKQIDGVLKFIRSRGMACSVYGSQFLLDAIYDANDPEYGLQLLTSTGERSWYNMIQVGSTITLEAWDNKYKPNQDWNHAWGAAPANLIPRKLMGIEPLEPGFRKISIKPQPGPLKSAEIKHPTIRGDVTVSFTNNPGQSFRLEVDIPANTTAEIYLPFYTGSQTIYINGQSAKYIQKGNFSVMEDVGSGKWTFVVER